MKMAWRNLWRNPRRSVLTILAIAFSGLLLVFMISFQFGTYDDMIELSLRVGPGHLQVAAEGYRENMEMRKVVENPEAIGRILEGLQKVSAYTYRANAFSLLSSEKRTYGAMIKGILPEREARVTTIEKITREGEYLSRESGNRILLGRTLAENLKLAVGDEVVLLGQGRDGSVASAVLKVEGIFSTGMPEMDRNMAMIHLDNFNELYFMRGAVHQVVAVCNTLDDVPAVERKIEAALEQLNSEHNLVVWNWRQLIPGLLQGIKIDLFSGVIFYLLLIIVVAFSILNTFLMAVFERTREFGVLLALGVTQARLTGLLLYESIFLTFTGLAAGMAGGALLTIYFSKQGIRIPGAEEILRQYGLPEVLRPELSSLSLLLGPAVVLGITFLTALYPALRVRFLKPANALRTSA
jgi:ABC-type lipoprotein release transport system permease subunit